MFNGNSTAQPIELLLEKDAAANSGALKIRTGTQQTINKRLRICL